MRFAARRRFGALGLAGLVTLVVLACTRRPEDAAFDNPFDPNGVGGDPFRVSAQVVGPAVSVGWRTPGIPGITRYAVLRSLAQNAGFGQVGEVPVTDNRPQYAFQDTGYARNRTNYYKVRAYRNAQVNVDSRVTAASVFAPPQIAIVGDSVFARAVTLRLRTDAGDTVEVAATTDFVRSSRFVIGSPVVLLPWTLSIVDSVGTRTRVYARVWTSGVAGSTIADSAVVAFKPRVVFSDSAIVDREVIVRSRGVGLAALRAATSRAGLANAPWIDNPRSPSAFDSIDVVFMLTSDSTTTPFFAESRSDFFFSRVDSLLAIPRPVGPAAIVLAGGAATTSDRNITIGAAARYATEMRYGESPDFTGVAWRPFAAISTFTLSAAPGPKTVYAFFRNGVDPTGESTNATITLVASVTR